MRRACPSCGRIIPATATHCDQHDVDNQRRNAKNAAHGVHRPHFQRLRRERLALAHDRCELHVDEHCTGKATSVHLDPQLEGNHDIATIDDVRAGCAHCHGVVDGGRSAEARGYPAPRPRTPVPARPSGPVIA